MGIIQQLRDITGPRGFTSDAATMAPYLTESTGQRSGRALAVVSPASSSEVSRVLRACHDSGVAVVPQGGNTGRCGGALSGAGQIILSLSRLNRIIAVDADNFTLTAEAGCLLSNLQQAALEHGRLFPLSMGSAGTCQLGGNLATNAGGHNALRYGSARQLALGLEVVLADGRLWRSLKGLRKDNSGYDLKQLFIGSEGTLGVITAATLRLFPLPRRQETILLALGALEASVSLLARLLAAAGERLSAFELIPRAGVEIAKTCLPNFREPFQQSHPWYVLIVVDAGGETPDPEQLLATAWQDGLVADALVAMNESQAGELWRLREAMVEAQRAWTWTVKLDISVRMADVPRFIHEATDLVRSCSRRIQVIAFGHVGDGNVHFNLGPAAGESGPELQELANRVAVRVQDLAVDMGGSFSAEHGVGSFRLREMSRHKSELELELMRSMKRALDPGGILNPGKVLP